jgi:hypothetical protein
LTETFSVGIQQGNFVLIARILFLILPPFSILDVTTRKSINTNGNAEGIFPSVNFRGILPTKIFPRYIPRELPWKKKLKQSKKNNDVSFLPT